MSGKVKTKQYHCKKCKFSSRLLSNMKRHIRKHTDYIETSSDSNLVDGSTNKENRSPELNFVKCETCSFTTSSRSKLKAHIEMHFRCDECNDVFETKQDLDCHKKDHFNRPFQCDGCSKRYKDKRGLKNHIRTQHGAESVKCSLCKKVCSNGEVLQKHMAKVHADNVKVECEECGKSVTRTYLASHRKLHAKDFKCKECGETFQGKEELKNHRNQHFVETYECDFCKKHYRYKRYLMLHLRVHLFKPRKAGSKHYVKTEGADMEDCKYEIDTCVDEPDDTFLQQERKKVRFERPFKCNEDNCKYSTSRYTLLKAHKFKHNPFYSCVTCQETFRARVELKKHMAVHGDRPFRCDQCGKCYKDSHGWGWHRKVQHDPSRLKFTCELCGKTYPFDSLLTQHINSTHAAEKQSVCDICGKNVSRSYLQMHRRTHGDKQFSCDLCGRSFMEKAYLKRHRMVHTGEKPYICSVCGNTFRQHSTLTIHMRTHTGDRPYKCQVCENAYKTHHNLKKHYKRTGHKMV